MKYCGGFCHTLTRISHRCTCVPHSRLPSPSHPSGLSQCTDFECPVSCIEFELAVYFTYGNKTCFSAVLSNHPTLTFSHRVQKSVLYRCVSFAVLHNIFPYTGEQMLSPVCLWIPIILFH